MMGAVPEVQIVLEANECRQHVVPRPAIASRTSPAIIVVWCPAYCARRVDLRRAAETQPAQVQPWLLTSCELREEVRPVVAATPDDSSPARLAHFGRGVRCTVVRASLEEQDLRRRVLRQSPSESSASRTSANDYVVITSHEC